MVCLFPSQGLNKAIKPDMMLYHFGYLTGLLFIDIPFGGFVGLIIFIGYFDWYM